MSEPAERLADLQRQRTLVREQLAWLDREIAAAQAASAPPASSPPPAPVPVPPPAAASAAAPDIPSLYLPDAAAAHADGRRGCFLYAAVAFALLFAALAAIYFLRYRDRSLIFVERPAPAAPASASPHK